MKKASVLGILGGLGPMSSAYFYELLIAHTDAACDQDHIDLVLSSRATTPDRTGYILHKSCENPVQTMISEAQKLVRYGADLIVIPCNTAHFFYDELHAAIHVPMLNIIEEAVRQAHTIGAEKIGILATDGTIQTQTYQRYSQKYGMECIVPNPDEQKEIMDIIYGAVKSGKEPNLKAFQSVGDSLLQRGADRIVLGCTELSLINKNHPLGEKYIDSLLMLAKATIIACGKKYIR